MILKVVIEVAAADQEAAERELHDCAARLGCEVESERFFPNGDGAPRHLWQRGVAVLKCA